MSGEGKHTNSTLIKPVSEPEQPREFLRASSQTPGGRGPRSWDSCILPGLSSSTGTPSAPRAQPISLPPSLCVPDFLRARTQNSSHYTSSPVCTLNTDHTPWSAASAFLKSHDCSSCTSVSCRVVSAQGSELGVFLVRKKKREGVI